MRLRVQMSEGKFTGQYIFALSEEQVEGWRAELRRGAAYANRFRDAVAQILSMHLQVARTVVAGQLPSRVVLLSSRMES